MTPLEDLDRLIASIERWTAYARSLRHHARRRKPVTPTSRWQRRTPRPSMSLRWGKGLEIETSGFCEVYLYESTRRVSPWSQDRESVVYAKIQDLDTVRAWIAEHPGPPGWGGYRPAVYVGDTVYALDYNDWISLRGWT